jgi:signal transduction histidine kinase
MANIKILRNQLIDALNEVKSLSHDLTADELDELIDEVKCLYERFSDMTEARTGVKP